MSLAGLLGLFFWNLTSLPGLWDRDLGIARKALVPLALGAALGAIDIAADMQTHLSRLVAAQMHLPTIHIAFPLSIPIYFGGAILVTILYYFVLLRRSIGWSPSVSRAMNGSPIGRSAACSRSSSPRPRIWARSLNMDGWRRRGSPATSR